MKIAEGEDPTATTPKRIDSTLESLDEIDSNMVSKEARFVHGSRKSEKERRSGSPSFHASFVASASTSFRASSYPASTSSSFHEAQTLPLPVDDGRSDDESRQSLQDIPEQIRHLAAEYYGKDEKFENDKKDVSVQMNVWDFGGESLYYSTHQMFLTPLGIYIVVFNLDDELSSDFDVSKDNNNNNQDNDNDDDDDGDSIYSQMPIYSSQEETPMTNLDFINFWMNSIHYYAANDRGTGNPFDAPLHRPHHGDEEMGERVAIPPILIVGTFFIFISVSFFLWFFMVFRRVCEMSFLS